MRRVRWLAAIALSSACSVFAFSGGCSIDARNGDGDHDAADAGDDEQPDASAASPDAVVDPPDSSPTQPDAAPDPSGYTRPYGPNAAWNVPVAGLPLHPETDHYSALLWTDAPADPGNYNLSFDDYTYPVYEASDATGDYPVELSTNWGNLDGESMPWNPDWLPATGTDGQVIVLDPPTGREWNLWQVSFSNGTVQASNGNLVPGSYWTKEDGFPSSRGCGIQYLAMLVRPEEIAQGEIPHALSMPIRNTDGDTYVPPATKLEHPDNPPGIPEGMRFALDVSDAEIEAWVAALPAELPEATRDSARVIGRALRDYGWFITDTSGGAHLQFEQRFTAGPEWAALGLDDHSAGGKNYPRDLLDGLITAERIYTIVPSDQYP